MGIVRLIQETGERLAVFNQRFKPSVKIEPQAHRMHGITASALARKKPFADSAKDISSILRRSDRLVMHQACWDGLVLRHQMNEAGVRGFGMRKTACTVKMAEALGLGRA